MLIEAKDDGSGGDHWSYRSCNAPVASSPPTNQHPFFLQAGCPSCHPTNSVKALKGKITHCMDFLTPSSLWGLPILSVTTNSSWLPWGSVAMALLHIPSGPLIANSTIYWPRRDGRLSWLFVLGGGLPWLSSALWCQFPSDYSLTISVCCECVCQVFPTRERAASSTAWSDARRAMSVQRQALLSTSVPLHFTDKCR